MICRIEVSYQYYFVGRIVSYNYVLQITCVSSSRNWFWIQKCC